MHAFVEIFEKNWWLYYLGKDRSLLPGHCIYTSSVPCSAPDAPIQSSRLMHVGVRLARRQISVCCPNSKFRAIDGLSLSLCTYTRMFDVCLSIAIARADSKAKRESRYVWMSVWKLQLGDIVTCQDAGLKANQGEPQRTLIHGWIE